MCLHFIQMQMSEDATKVILISEDGIKFPVSLPVLRCIGLFKNLLELQGTSTSNISLSLSLSPINVSNVTSLILDKIIEYLDNYVTSRDISAVVSNKDESKKAPLKVKNTIVSMASNTTSTRNIDDDDDDDYDDEEETQVFPNEGSECLIEKDSEFEMISDEEDNEDDESSAFDFENFDEQSLRLFTPFEQQFFSSLDIPTLIEITKVSLFSINNVILY